MKHPKEDARIKKIKWRTKYEVNTIVMELVNSVVARSAVRECWRR